MIRSVTTVLLLLFLSWINIQRLSADDGEFVEPENSTEVAITISQNKTSREKIKLKLLLVLPISEETEADDDNSPMIHRSRWQRGLEMIPGAQIAVHTINNDPNLLPGYELELVRENVDPRCSPFTAIHSDFRVLKPFVNGTLDNNTVGMLGLFCDRLLPILSPLVGRSHFGLFQLSGTMSTNERRQRQRYTHLNFIVPSEAAYYETFFTFVRKLDRKRVLIIDNDFFNMSSVRNSTLLRQNLSISYLEFFSNISSVLKEIRMSEKTVVFVSATLKQTADLMCAVYDDGLVWPQYMWIVQHYKVCDLLNLNYDDGNCSPAKLKNALNQTLFIRFQYEQTDIVKELVTGSTYETYIQQYMQILNESSEMLNYNEYANIMHDSVWAFALALNRSLDRILQFNMTIIDFVNKFGREQLTNAIEENLPSLLFDGASGRVQFNDQYDIEANVFVTLANHDGNDITIGYYDQSLRNFYLNGSSLPPILPSDKPPDIYKHIPIAVTIVLTIFAILSLLLTTIMFVLFIKYRKYSEIKATSPYLSLLMFVGTYLILISTLVQAILTAIVSPVHNVASAALCGSVISGNVIGINLIFATLLLRMLRINHIFSYFGNISKVWSDKFLVIIVLLVVCGDVVLLLVWFFLDPFTMYETIILVYENAPNPPYYEVRQYCSSYQNSVWFSITFVKVGILFAIVVFLSIKMRKIQRANFKDTKKVNIYIFTTVLIIATLIPAWFLLKERGNVLGAGIVICVSFGSTGLFNQLMLFAPKVLPLVLRSMGFNFGQSLRNTQRTTTIIDRHSRGSQTVHVTAKAVTYAGSPHTANSSTGTCFHYNSRTL